MVQLNSSKWILVININIYVGIFVNRDCEDHPHYRKNWLVPTFFSRNIDFLIFMQFVAIFPKWSSDESTTFGKPGHMGLFYLKQVFLNKITVLESIYFQILSSCLFSIILMKQKFSHKGLYTGYTHMHRTYMFLIT